MEGVVWPVNQVCIVFFFSLCVRSDDSGGGVLISMHAVPSLPDKQFHYLRADVFMMVSTILLLSLYFM